MPLSCKRPWIIGHRGAPGEEPENTLTSFKLAIRQGADLIEQDLHMSADKQLVVIHDDTVIVRPMGGDRSAVYPSPNFARLMRVLGCIPSFAANESRPDLRRSILRPVASAWWWN